MFGPTKFLAVTQQRNLKLAFDVLTGEKSSETEAPILVCIPSLGDTKSECKRAKFSNSCYSTCNRCCCVIRQIDSFVLYWLKKDSLRLPSTIEGLENLMWGSLLISQKIADKIYCSYLTNPKYAGNL